MWTTPHISRTVAPSRTSQVDQQRKNETMSFTQQGAAVDDSLVSFLDGIEFTSEGAVVYHSNKDAFCSSDFSSACNNGSPYSGSTEFSSTDSDDSLSSLLFSSQLGDDDDDSALGFEFTACDWDVSSPVLPPLSVQPLAPQQQQVEQGKQQRKKAPARAKKGAVAGTTTVTETVVPPALTKRPRKHNRIEIIKLREQVEELQARQAKLQKFRSDRNHQLQQQDKSVTVSVSVAVAAQQQETYQSGTKLRKTANGSKTVTTAIVAAAPRSVWFDLAVQQYRGLQESEALNRKLRDAVAKQLKVTNSFQALLQKKVSSQDLDLLLEIPQPVASAMQSQFLSSEEQKLTELYATMERQFFETDLVCHRLATINDITSVFSTSQTKQDAVCGPMFELITNTPVANSFQLLARTMWSRIIEKKGLPVVTPPPSRRASKTPSLLAFHDKQVQLTVASRLGDLHVEGVVAISKFEELHRIVITIASTYTVSNSCVMLREHAWIIVSDTTTRLDDETTGSSSPLWGAPTQAALFQTFYRLHSEKQDASSATGSSPFAEKEVLDEDTSYVQELVMKSLSDKMRQHMMQLQTSLLAEIGGLSAYMNESKCPLIECGC